MDSKVDEVKKILETKVGATEAWYVDKADAVAQEICALFEPQDKEQDADLREQIDQILAEMEYDWIVHPPLKDKEVIASYLATKLLAAGWHQCPEVEWPVLSTSQLLGICCNGDFTPDEVLQAKLKAQRKADRAHCPAQQDRR